MVSDLPIEKISVFQSHEENFPIFRIPALLKTHNGTLLAFAEARQSLSDAAENQLVLKRSIDQGYSWEKIIHIYQHGKDSLNNPCVVECQITHRIFLFFQLYPFPCKERDVIPGYNGSKCLRNLMTHSDDDGQSWTEPIDLTEFTKRPTIINTISTGPGIGIQLRRGEYKGRLIIPVNQGPWGQWTNYAIYSDDHGKSWSYGDTVPFSFWQTGGNEVQMVELIDGSILLNARNYRKIFTFGPNFRKIAISSNGGKSWGSYKKDQTLIEPSCQASLFRFSDPLDGEPSRILFANPTSKLRRINGTIYISYDEGKTWPQKKVIELGAFAYSCLCRVSTDIIGCLYETGHKNCYETIMFARVPLNSITDDHEQV
jgi:sialidase-1